MPPNGRRTALQTWRRNSRKLCFFFPCGSRKQKAAWQQHGQTPRRRVFISSGVLVPLDSREARQWLQFAPITTPGETAWFRKLEPVTCDIRWTEAPEGHTWTGKLDRVVNFDQQTRTLTVAVRVAGRDALSRDAARLPLVDGMFCSVGIPGKTVIGVVRLPRWAVSFENTVYVSENGRLKTRPVKVARAEGEDAFVQGGLSQGDIVIITRLVDPLENVLLDLKLKGAEDNGS
jgi:hypothetical protein